MSRVVTVAFTADARPLAYALLRMELRLERSWWRRLRLRVLIARLRLSMRWRPPHLRRVRDDR